MEIIGTIGGGAPVIKRYQAGTTISARGIPVTGSITAATDLASVEPIAASAAAQALVGLCLDTSGTVAATGITNSDNLLVSVVVNPDAIFRGRMCAGTTSGTALASTSAVTAQADGTVVNSATTITEGAVFGYTGANAGELRRADDTAGSVSINFPKGIAAGDTFLAVHGFPCCALAAGNMFFDLTTDLTEVVAQTSVTDTDNFVCFDLEMRDSSEDGIYTSYYHLIANDHLFNAITRS